MKSLELTRRMGKGNVYAGSRRKLSRVLGRGSIAIEARVWGVRF